MFHKEELLGEDVTFLWRYLDQDENEMEGVVIARTTSFVAIGNISYNDLVEGKITLVFSVLPTDSMTLYYSK